jgi:ATP-dependent Lon protease
MELHDLKEVGVATGLAWTEAGGALLPVETTLMPGKGTLTLTGKLGDVMQESAKAALSYIRSNHKSFGLSADFYKKLDVHIHAPEGAVPKDGPSAGVTMTISMLSALTKRPVRRDVAMTGEMTLLGKVLKIGGLKEKVLAAHRLGVETVIIPADNEPELVEIAEEIRSALKFVTVKTIDDAIAVAFVDWKRETKTQEEPAGPKKKVRKRPSRGRGRRVPTQI